MLEHGFRKYEIIKLLNDIKKRIKRVEENVPIQIDDAINQLLNGAPQALDTLKELADALGNDSNFATSIANQITELNNKIDSIDIKKDWNQNDENADDYIENRTHYAEKILICKNDGNGRYDNFKNLFEEGFPGGSWGVVRKKNNTEEIFRIINTTNGYQLAGPNIYTTVYFDKDYNNYLEFQNDIIKYIKDNIDSTRVGTVNEGYEFQYTIEYHKLNKEYLYTPDWNQFNEEDGSFIKNKTHYKYINDIYLTKNNIPSSFREFYDIKPEQEGVSGILFKIPLYDQDYNNIINNLYIYIYQNHYIINLYIDNRLATYFNYRKDFSSQIVISDDVSYNTIFDAIYQRFKDGVVCVGNIVGYIKFLDEYHKLDSNYLPDNINDSIILKESSIPSEGIEANKFYELGEIAQDTTFVLKAPTNNNILNKYIIQFSIGTTIPTITWPSNIKWENGNVPTINADKTYLLEIINDLAQIKEF